MKKTLIYVLGLGLLLAGCTPKIQYKITKPASNQLGGIENLQLGAFEDLKGRMIPLPAGQYRMGANREAAEIFRGHLESLVSIGNDYRLLNGSEVNSGKAGETAIISAKVAYGLEVAYSTEKQAFHPTSYIIEKPQRSKEDAMLDLIAQVAVPTHHLETPIMEKLAALEVTLEIRRKSDQQLLLPSKTITKFYYRNWGTESVKMVDRATYQAILKSYPKVWHNQMSIYNPSELQQSDPTQYQAEGFHLKNHQEVAETDQDILALLVEEAAYEFAREVVKTHQLASLQTEDGDEQAKNLIQGGAFQAAADRLHSLPQPLIMGDLFNLALSYEAMGNYPRARVYYQEGLERFKRDQFKSALARIQ